MPPVSGAPPRLSNKFMDEPLPHKLIEPLVPAFGGGVSVTVTVAEASVHGAVPVKVYV